MYESVLFDVDGVLLRRHEDHPTVYGEAIAETFRAFDVDPAAVDLDAFVGAATLEEMVAECERHGIEFERFWPERERRVSELQQRLMERRERALYDDCSVLSSLAERYDLGLVSNNQHETIQFMVDHFDLGDRIAVAYGREPTVEGFRRTKPDTHYVERALSDLGAESALYVGDSAVDVTAAHDAGLDSAFVRRPHRRGYALPDAPTYEIDALTDLESILGGE